MMLAAGSLCRRELVRFFRQRSRVMGALGTPLVFWLMFGSGAGNLAYLFPGIVVMILLFTAIFSTISIIEDRREGFLQGVLVAPVSRSAIVLGKVLGGMVVATAQGAVFLALAPLVGLRLGLGQAAAAVGVMALTAFGLTSLGVFLAWRFDSIQGFHAVMNLFLMPLWFLSGAVFKAETAAGWVRAVMVVDPLTYGVAALRRILTGEGGGPALGVSLGVTAGFAALSFVLAVLTASRERRGGV